MTDWLIVLVAATAGSLISLLGGLYLIYGKRGVVKLRMYSVPFAAGALLAAAFFDLLPEALGGGAAVLNILSMTLIGFLVFFVLDSTLSWFHHHKTNKATDTPEHHNASLVVIGDAIHNLVDGVAIGAAFLANPVTGIVTTIAIAAHEIPQEIGDFGLLLSKNIKPARVVAINIAIGLLTVVSAATVFALGQNFALPLQPILGLTAGFFIYIAASDIIPSIHAIPNKRLAGRQSAVLLLGVAVVATMTSMVHHLIG